MDEKIQELKSEIDIVKAELRRIETLFWDALSSNNTWRLIGVVALAGEMIQKCNVLLTKTQSNLYELAKQEKETQDDDNTRGD